MEDVHRVAKSTDGCGSVVQDRTTENEDQRPLAIDALLGLIGRRPGFWGGIPSLLEDLWLPLRRSPLQAPGGRHRRVVVAFTDEKLRLGPQAKALNADKLIARAAKAADYKGRLRKVLTLLVPDVDGVDRLILVGLGEPGDIAEEDWRRLGGVAFGAVEKGPDVTVSPREARWKAGRTSAGILPGPHASLLHLRQVQNGSRR